eukprot:1275408-Prymnesium_polylepis.2
MPGTRQLPSPRIASVCSAVGGYISTGSWSAMRTHIHTPLGLCPGGRGGRGQRHAPRPAPRAHCKLHNHRMHQMRTLSLAFYKRSSQRRRRPCDAPTPRPNIRKVYTGDAAALARATPCCRSPSVTVSLPASAICRWEHVLNRLTQCPLLEPVTPSCPSCLSVAYLRSAAVKRRSEHEGDAESERSAHGDRQQECTRRVLRRSSAHCGVALHHRHSHRGLGVRLGVRLGHDLADRHDRDVL